MSSNGLRKVASSVQILTRAKDEILKLEKLEAEYTALRKEMMLKRYLMNFSTILILREINSILFCLQVRIVQAVYREIKSFG